MCINQVDPSKPLFGFIGRLEEQKGVDILLAALPDIAKKGDVQVMHLKLAAVNKSFSDCAFADYGSRFLPVKA